MIVAEADVDSSPGEASNGGFRLIARYIFGDNRSRQGSASEKIAVTALVTIVSGAARIAMTEPIMEESADGVWRVQFVMPARYTLTSLPTPTDPFLSREISAQKTAVIVSSGFAGEDNVKEKSAALFDWIKARTLEAISGPRLARYSPPWTLPFLRRNGIMINIR